MVNMRKLSFVMISSLGMLLGVGCAKDRHDDIPKSARLVAQERGNIDFLAPEQGMVYVYDHSNGKMLYSGRIENGDHLKVEPRDDRISLNGRSVMEKQIRDNDDLKVFYQEDPRATVAGSRTVVVPADRGRDNIVVQPREEERIRIKNNDPDSKVTVEPGSDGSTIRIHREDK